MPERVTTEKEIRGMIGGVDERHSDSILAADKFTKIEGVAPHQETVGRIFGKSLISRAQGALESAVSILSIHAGPGNQIFIQTDKDFRMVSSIEPDTSIVLPIVTNNGEPVTNNGVVITHGA